MKKVSIIVCATLFLILAAPCSSAQTSGPRTRVKSCRHFVQGFYDWYVPEVFRSFERTDDPDPFNLVLKDRRSAFSPALLRALREDHEAQAEVDKIVGLDFDPFLASQDPSERFVVGTVKLVGDKCLAVVRGVSAGKEREHVVPESAYRNGRWLFVNFHYPESKSPSGENLVSILNLLRAKRQKNH